MKIFTLFTLAAVSLAVGLAAACSTATNSTNTNQTKTAANTANTEAANSATAPKKDEDVLASVKAIFPGAGSFTKQHKVIPKDAIIDIEKDSGGNVPDTDHHSYLAFSTEGGTKKQIGAATVVTANGKEFVIVYENKNGSPFIKEVRAEGVAPAFLAQFAGKGHDDKFKMGTDIEANGVDDGTAKAITAAIQIDALTMQNLYGSAHSH
ncbi:MAG: hypothetical protein WKF34_00030 [Pyrinomonadaceae bacterium]